MIVVCAPAMGSRVGGCSRAGDCLFGGPLFSWRGEPQVAGEASAVERVLLVAVGITWNVRRCFCVELANADPSQKLAIVDEREIAQDWCIRTSCIGRPPCLPVMSVWLVCRSARACAGGNRTQSDELAPAQLESLRDQIRDEHLIFKMRVAGSKLAQEETL